MPPCILAVARRPWQPLIGDSLQARRLESQLYQRAQDARRIERAQEQAHDTMMQVRRLEKYHVEQAARIRHGTKAIEELQLQMREASKEHDLVLSTCEALHEDIRQLTSSLRAENPSLLEQLALSVDLPSMKGMRERASQLEASISEADRRVSMHIASTPSTTVRKQPRPCRSPAMPFATQSRHAGLSWSAVLRLCRLS